MQSQSTGSKGMDVWVIFGVQKARQTRLERESCRADHPGCSAVGRLLKLPVKHEHTLRMIESAPRHATT
jgi:hypothetical protein